MNQGPTVHCVDCAHIKSGPASTNLTMVYLLFISCVPFEHLDFQFLCSTFVFNMFADSLHINNYKYSLRPCKELCALGRVSTATTGLLPEIAIYCSTVVPLHCLRNKTIKQEKHNNSQPHTSNTSSKTSSASTFSILSLAKLK
jgi:hypothetical protein